MQSEDVSEAHFILYGWKKIEALLMRDYVLANEWIK